MSASATPAKLYTPDLLALAVELARFPFDDSFEVQAEARSRSCGSVVLLGLNRDAEGAVARIGVSAKACAVGQAAAALFALDAAGRTCADMARAAAALDGWLNGSGAQPDWRGIEALDPARAHPGRHEAIRLPWRAALAALPNTAPHG